MKTRSSANKRPHVEPSRPDYDARFLAKLQAAEAEASAEDPVDAVRIAFPRLTESTGALLIERIEDAFAERMARADPEDKLYVIRSSGTRGSDFYALFDRGDVVDDWLRRMHVHCLDAWEARRTAAQEWIAQEMDMCLRTLAAEWNATHSRFTLETHQGYLLLNV